MFLVRVEGAVLSKLHILLDFLDRFQLQRFPLPLTYISVIKSVFDSCAALGRDGTPFVVELRLGRIFTLHPAEIIGKGEVFSFAEAMDAPPLLHV